MRTIRFGILLLAGFSPFLCNPSAGAAEYIVDGRNSAAFDSNPGTSAQPLKTIGSAVARLQPGDTVTIKTGIYREFLEITVSGSEDKPIVIQAAPEDRVVLTGADFVKGWTKIEDAKKRPIWQKTSWTGWDNCNNSIDGIDRKTGPQLIVDDSLQRRVGAMDKMKPGSYFFDPTQNGGTIYLWMMPPPKGTEGAPMQPGAWWDEPVNLTSDDPNKHQVEASTRPQIIKMTNQSYVTFRGLVLRYDTGGAQEGGFEVAYKRGKARSPMAASSHDTIENCIVEFCHGRGLTTSGDHITVRGCYLRYNGSSGAGGNLRDSLWDNDVLDGNSTLGISPGFEAGGVKFLFTTGLMVRHCQFLNNFGPGLWFDTGNSGNTVEQNFCSFNESAGIMFEVSPDFSSIDLTGVPMVAQRKDDNPEDLKAEETMPVRPNIVRNNICVSNWSETGGGLGILLQLASNTEVLNNTLVGNGEYGIFVRYHPYDTSGHRCINNTILNNICVDNGPHGGDQIGMTPDPASHPGWVSNNRSDYNLFWSTEGWLSHNPANQEPDGYPDEAQFGRWGKTEFGGAYSTEEIFDITGREEHSFQRLPHFVSASSFDYRLLPGSPAIGAGIAHADMGLDFLGRERPAGQPPSLGALEYFPCDDTPPAMPMTGVTPAK